MEEDLPMSSSIAAIICTWNKRDDLLECLASLAKVAGEPFDVVVVDNASSDGTTEAVRRRFPAAKLIVNTKNLGGAGGFNSGLRYVLDAGKYRFAWLLDNDVVVDPGALTGLRAEFDRDPTVAIAGSLILRRDTPTTLQELGARVSLETFEREPIYKDYPLAAIGKEPLEVDYVPACSLLVDLEKVRRVGLLDEEFFLYYDDVEWCIRMKRAGYRVMATPMSRVWHREGGRNRTSNLPVYYAWRNAFHFFMTTVAGTPHVEPFFQVFLKRAFVAINLTHRLGKPNSCRTIASAMWDAILGRRGPAPASRALPLDLGTGKLPWEPAEEPPAFLCPELEFYTALRFLVGAEERTRREKPDFYTPVPADRLPVWLVERVKLHAEEEVAEIATGTPLVILCRHVVTGPHPQERPWQRMLRARGNGVCFFDQHSNVVRGITALSRLRKSLAQDWQWFHGWIAPLLSERMAQIGERGPHE